MNILVTGGAGYIGSHVVKHLINAKSHKITILDNLSTGLEKTLGTLSSLDKELKLVQADLADWPLVEKVMKENKFDAVVHFAASIVVPESVAEPMKYYMNNTVNTAHLIKCCLDNNVKRFVFSSTAAVYGEPNNVPDTGLSEDSVLSPINPYGRTKLFSEHIIKDAGHACPDFKYVILRYFNVAGADKDGLIGQSGKNSTHLIKIASETALGKRAKMSIFGSDYPTPDGTCVRDYIHVDDLASAHVCALNYLSEHDSNIFNCGYGKGYSVKEVVEVMKKVSGVDFIVESAGRRDGDPALLVADSRKMQKLTGWKPQYADLAYICKTALNWEKKLTETV